MISFVAAIALLSSTAFGHMCLLSPYQRPGMVNSTELSTPGAAECGRTTGPCGGVSNGILNALIMSETSTIVLEKNLDHFNKDKAGNFTVSLWSDKGEFIRTLGSVMDDARPSGSIYQVPVPVPHEGGESKFIIQAVYYTNNPNAPAAFYQCADVEIFPRD